LSTVRTLRLFENPAFSGGPTVVYTCAAGLLTVVECISIVYGDVVVSGLDAWVQLQDGTKLCRSTWLVGQSPPTPGYGTDLFVGKWVLEPGDTLALQTADGTVDFTGAGYTLTLP
jgi:hypothetical protein